MITGFLQNIEPIAFDLLVKPVREKYTKTGLIDGGTTFRNHPYTIEGIDVIFQTSNRPKGTLPDGKDYWSEKHRSYGYKVEASVRPNGLASDFSFHDPASESDCTILFERIEEAEIRIRKQHGGEEIINNWLLHEIYPQFWSIMADKGYQGMADHLRVITPKKRLPHEVLTLGKERNNRNIASDRIIVENVFGRLGKLRGVCSKKFELSEVKYDIVRMYSHFFGDTYSLCSLSLDNTVLRCLI